MRTAFLKSFGKVGAIAYSSGIAVHLLRLLLPNFPSDIISLWFDAWIVLAAAYAAAGFGLFWRRILFWNKLHVILYPVITVHLLGYSAFHAYTFLAGHRQTHNLFPAEYSYAVVLLMGVFAWFSWRLKLKESL